MRKTIKLKGGSGRQPKPPTPSQRTVKQAINLAESTSPKSMNTIRLLNTARKNILSSINYKTETQKKIVEAARKLKADKSKSAPLKRIFASIKSFFTNTQFKRTKKITNLREAVKIISNKLKPYNTLSQSSLDLESSANA